MKLLTILCNEELEFNNKNITTINIDSTSNIYDIIRNINTKYLIYIKNYDDYVDGFIDKV